MPSAYLPGASLRAPGRYWSRHCMAQCVSPLIEVPKYQVPLAFLYPPEKPSIFSRPLGDVTVTEGEDMTLVCETTTLDSSVRWTKDGKTLRPSARCQLSYEGCRAQLVITGTTLQDGGRYKCEVGGASSSSIVRVHGECQMAMFGVRIKYVHKEQEAGSPEPLLAPLLHLSIRPCAALGFLVSQGLYCPRSLSTSLGLLSLDHAPFLTWVWWTPLPPLPGVPLPACGLPVWTAPKLAALTSSIDSRRLPPTCCTEWKRSRC